jgi:hypothetical protein
VNVSGSYHGRKSRNRRKVRITVLGVVRIVCVVCVVCVCLCVASSRDLMVEYIILRIMVARFLTELYPKKKLKE